MGICKIFVESIVFLIVFILGIAFLPGLPPHGTFESFVTEPLLPRVGAFAPNTRLNAGRRLFEDRFVGPESIAVRDGQLYVSMHGGAIVKVHGKNFDEVKQITRIGPSCDGPWDERTCGRPLGLRFSRDGKLLVADSYLGIFRVDVDTGEKERIVDPSEAIDGALPLLIDDLDEDAQGNVFWSDASTIGPLEQGVYEMLAGPSGRLVKLDGVTGRNEVLLPNLHFANGVQLSPAEDFVLVAETFRFRVLRYWLRGPLAGTSDVFIAGLPGFPDNIRAKQGGGYYVSLCVVRDPADDMSEEVAASPLLRRFLTRVIYAVQKIFEGIHYLRPAEWTAKAVYNAANMGQAARLLGNKRSMVVMVDAVGTVAGVLEGDNGAMGAISETVQVGNQLFFGSPFNKFLGVLDMETKIKIVSDETGLFGDAAEEEETIKDEEEETINADEEETINAKEKQTIASKKEQKQKTKDVTGNKEKFAEKKDKSPEKKEGTLPKMEL